MSFSSTTPVTPWRHVKRPVSHIRQSCRFGLREARSTSPDIFLCRHHERILHRPVPTLQHLRFLSPLSFAMASSAPTALLIRRSCTQISSRTQKRSLSSQCLRISNSRTQRREQRRWQSTDAATADAAVSPKIAGIVDQISTLTLLETADLVKTLKVCSCPVLLSIMRTWHAPWPRYGGHTGALDCSVLQLPRDLRNA